MPATLEQLAKAVGGEASGELDRDLGLIQHCVGQLTDEQLWWRPSSSMNSIANLLLHLSGNLRQWIVSGLGGVADDRNRQNEFDQRESASKAQLMRHIEVAVAEAKQALAAASAQELLRVRRVQGTDISGMRAIFDSVAHFRGHTQEIIHMTRCQLADAYQFDFVPDAAGNIQH